MKIGTSHRSTVMTIDGVDVLISIEIKHFSHGDDFTEPVDHPVFGTQDGNPVYHARTDYPEDTAPDLSTLTIGEIINYTVSSFTGHRLTLSGDNRVTADGDGRIIMG